MVRGKDSNRSEHQLLIRAERRSKILIAKTLVQPALLQDSDVAEESDRQQWVESQILGLAAVRGCSSVTGF